MPRFIVSFDLMQSSYGFGPSSSTPMEIDEYARTKEDAEQLVLSRYDDLPDNYWIDNIQTVEAPDSEGK